MMMMMHRQVELAGMRTLLPSLAPSSKITSRSCRVDGIQYALSVMRLGALMSTMAMTRGDYYI